jgi:hypothetical protein
MLLRDAVMLFNAGSLVQFNAVQAPLSTGVNTSTGINHWNLQIILKSGSIEFLSTHRGTFKTYKTLDSLIVDVSRIAGNHFKVQAIV